MGLRQRRRRGDGVVGQRHVREPGRGFFQGSHRRVIGENGHFTTRLVIYVAGVVTRAVSRAQLPHSDSTAHRELLGFARSVGVDWAGSLVAACDFAKLCGLRQNQQRLVSISRRVRARRDESGSTARAMPPWSWAWEAGQALQNKTLPHARHSPPLARGRPVSAPRARRLTARESCAASSTNSRHQPRA